MKNYVLFETYLDDSIKVFAVCSSMEAADKYINDNYPGARKYDDFYSIGDGATLMHIRIQEQEPVHIC